MPIGGEPGREAPRPGTPRRLGGVVPRGGRSPVASSRDGGGHVNVAARGGTGGFEGRLEGWVGLGGVGHKEQPCRRLENGVANGTQWRPGSL